MEIESSKKSANISKYANMVKEFFVPTTRKDKQKRIKQYRDVFVFLAAILIMSTCESKIEKLLSVDPSEVQKISKMQSGPY